MTWEGLKRALSTAVVDVQRHHTLQIAAALSYYLVLSVFPALMFLSAVAGSIPLPDLFGHVLGFMSQLLPPDTMKMVVSVLFDIISTNRRAWLSFGTIGTLWVATAAFAAIVEALDIAYDVDETRPYWKTRLLSVGLAACTGFLIITALAVMIVGPRFGAWLAGHLHVSYLFVLVWPVLRWSIAVIFTLIAVEVIYFVGPNVQQRFGATLPGAALAVGSWIMLSYGLGFYFQHVANFSRTYGTLGGIIAFMSWFYWNSFALIVGAELNAELAKESSRGQIEQKPAVEEQPLPKAA